MQLRDYLHTYRIRSVDFAALCGISQPSLSRIVNGHQTPHADTIRAIVAASRGLVTADDLLGITPATVEQSQ
jgi:DNA-binding transcriptional regulator YdaS (Cro superfamily)